MNSGSPPPQFWYALCASECQKLLKREVALRYPSLRFAYSRPGLVTFKGELEEDFSPRLARHSGQSWAALGPDGSMSLPRGVNFDSKYRVRLWSSTPSEGLSSVPQAARAELGAIAFSQIESAGLVLSDETDATPLDVVISSESAERPGVPLFWGLAQRLAGRAEILVPELAPPGAPSRAYSKLKEVMVHLGLTTGKSDTALELGAAPGGATLALLESGLDVIAVDPGQMDSALPTLAANLGQRYRHVRKKASALERSDLTAAEGPVTWLVSDINLAPPVAVAQLSHALALVKRSVRVLVITFKINDERALASVPTQLARLGQLTGATPICVHLPSHRCEFGVVLDLSEK